MFRVDLIKTKQKRKSKGFYARFFLSKQKIKSFYGFIKEDYFKSILCKSLSVSNSKGLKHKPLLSSIFLSFLERRLDVLLYRSGFFPSIYSARQAISHNHIFVDARRVNFPSFQVSKGQVISFDSLITSLLKKYFIERKAFLGELKEALLKRNNTFKNKQRKFNKHKKFKKFIKFKKSLIPSHLFVDINSLTFVLLKNFFDVKCLVYPFKFNIQDVLMFYKT